MTATLLKTNSKKTFWDNYCSEHFWKAASATYFLYNSCKYVVVLWNCFGWAANFFRLQINFEIRGNKSTAKCENLFKVNDKSRRMT